MAGYGYDKNKKRWRVDFYDDEGARRRRLFKFKQNAVDFWKYLEFREERLGAGLDYKDPILFSEAVHIFKEQYLVTRSKTYQVSEARRLDQLSQHFEGKWLHDLDKATLDDFIIIRLRDNVSHKTILNDISILSSLFKWAISRGYAVENPTTQLNKPSPLPRRVRRALSEKEVEQILRHSCECCSALLVILVNTGIRMGELVQLEKRDFDLDRNVLCLKHTERTPLKGKAARIIPLNDIVKKVVSDLPEGKLLTMSREAFAEHFRATCKRARIEACLHELRHTYVTALVASGIDLKTAQQFSGHKDIQTLEKYLHWTGKGIEELRNRIGFSVTVRSQQPESVRKTWENSKLYGDLGFLKNQIVKENQRPSRTSPTGFEPVSSP